MMLSYRCDVDKVEFRVSKLDPQIHILSVTIDCPICRKSLTVSSNSNADDGIPVGVALRILTATELFQASNGLGLPSYEHASFDRVRWCLLESRIIDIDISPITPHRVLINSLTIEGPKKCVLYFGSSTKGATIYRITETSDA